MFFFSFFLSYATRHVLAAFGKNDPALVRRLKARFTSPVFPGETIETHMWQRGGRIHVECFVPVRRSQSHALPLSSLCLSVYLSVCQSFKNT